MEGYTREPWVSRLSAGPLGAGEAGRGLEDALGDAGGVGRDARPPRRPVRPRRPVHARQPRVPQGAPGTRDAARRALLQRIKQVAPESRREARGAGLEAEAGGEEDGVGAGLEGGDLAVLALGPGPAAAPHRPVPRLRPGRQEARCQLRIRPLHPHWTRLRLKVGKSEAGPCRSSDRPRQRRRCGGRGRRGRGGRGR